MKARIIVQNKPGVFDPQGKVVEAGLARLGYEGIERVRVGKVMEIELAASSREEATRAIEKMCEQFLVNPVIEDFTIEWP